MALFMFAGTIVLFGLIASFIPVGTLSMRSDQPDYHFVPSAGDVFGA